MNEWVYDSCLSFRAGASSGQKERVFPYFADNNLKTITDTNNTFNCTTDYDGFDDKYYSNIGCQ